VASVNTNDQLNEIGSMKRRVQEKTAEARAKISTNERRTGKDLDKQLRELEDSSDDDYLSKLLGSNAVAESVSAPVQTFTPAAVTHSHTHNHTHSTHDYTPSSYSGDSGSSSSSGSDGGSCGGGSGGGDC
jgi:hypothetical protein